MTREKFQDLPFNLDEAAEEWVRPIMRNPSKAYEFLYTYLLDAFKKAQSGWRGREKRKNTLLLVQLQARLAGQPSFVMWRNLRLVTR